jgi:hypothetical protein
MEDQIKASLITLHKVAGFTASTRIDTTAGDCDQFVETFMSKVLRALPVVGDNRTKAKEMLIAKYKAVKEHTTYIMQSRSDVLEAYLPQIRKQLEASKEGLTLYRSNPIHTGDPKITSTVDHLLEEEIPGQLSAIDRFLAEKSQVA